MNPEAMLQVAEATIARDARQQEALRLIMEEIDRAAATDDRTTQPISERFMHLGLTLLTIKNIVIGAQAK